MLPFLEVETTNQKSVITKKQGNLAQNLQEKDELEKGSETFVDLLKTKTTKDDEKPLKSAKDTPKDEKEQIKKTDLKVETKEIKEPKDSKDIKEAQDSKDLLPKIEQKLEVESKVKNLQENFINIKNDKENLQNDFVKSPKAQILKSLDEKYQLSKPFLESQSKNIAKIPLNSARDLLEFSMQNQKKTLRDLQEVAENLKLNIKKMAVNGDLKKEKENTPLNSLKDSIAPIVIKSTPQQNAPQKPNNKSDSIFNTLLFDKDLIKEKAQEKVAQEKGKKLESKDKELKEAPKVVLDSKDLKEIKTKGEKEIKTAEQKAQDKEKLEIPKDDLKENLKPNLKDDKEKLQEAKLQKDEIRQEIKKKIKEDSSETLKYDLKAESKIKQEQSAENLKADELNAQIKAESKEVKADVAQIKTAPKEQKILQDALQNPFQNALKEPLKEVIKDSTKEKEIKQKEQKEKEIKAQVETKIIKEQLQENTQRVEIEQKSMNNFLDNLLKTKEKPKEKEIPPKEQEKRQEKVDDKKEIYQHSAQSIKENTPQIERTFTHFSNALRDAVLNYKPPVTKLSFELNPDNLGSIELTIVKNGDKLSVQISSNQNALQLMWQNAQEFRNSLSNLGFQDIELDFKDANGNNLSDSSFNQGQNEGGGGFFNQNQGQGHRNNNEFVQNSQENEQEGQKWNENSLQFNKNASNPYARIAIVELNFSYYA